MKKQLNQSNIKTQIPTNSIDFSKSPYVSLKEQLDDLRQTDELTLSINSFKESKTKPNHTEVIFKAVGSEEDVRNFCKVLIDTEFKERP